MRITTTPRAGDKGVVVWGAKTCPFLGEEGCRTAFGVAGMVWLSSCAVAVIIGFGSSAIRHSHDVTGSRPPWSLGMAVAWTHASTYQMCQS